MIGKGKLCPTALALYVRKVTIRFLVLETRACRHRVASRTRIWNDNWTHAAPKGGSTRCGTATMIGQEVLAEAMERLGRKLAYFIRLRIWDREREYGDYSESERTFLCLIERARVIGVMRVEYGQDLQYDISAAVAFNCKAWSRASLSGSGRRARDVM